MSLFDGIFDGIFDVHNFKKYENKEIAFIKIITKLLKLQISENYIKSKYYFCKEHFK